MSTQVLSVSLPASAVYVSGTVNDVAVTWTNTSGNTWKAQANRSEDDIYRVNLTVIDSAGVSTGFSMTLYMGVVNLITDRTGMDVIRWRELAQKGWHDMTDSERAEWSAGMKGAYNATDMNRVGAAVKYIAERFASFGYSVSVDPKTDWAMSVIPSEKQLQEYLGNVRILRQLVCVFPTTPNVPADMEQLDFNEANHIEQILLDLNTILNHIAADWYYSGEVYSGEV